MQRPEKSWAVTMERGMVREEHGRSRNEGTRTRAVVGGWFARARPPAAFDLMRACWYASAAMSETNFCAASARSRFLKCVGRRGEQDSALRWQIQARQMSHGSVRYANKRSSEYNGQTGVLTVKANPLEVVVRHLIRYLPPFVCQL